MIKYLDNFYKRLYKEHIIYTLYNENITYDEFISNLSYYVHHNHVLTIIGEYHTIIKVFEKYYCKFNDQNDNELVYFIEHWLISDFQEHITKELRLVKIKKWMKK